MMSIPEGEQKALQEDEELRRKVESHRELTEDARKSRENQLALIFNERVSAGNRRGCPLVRRREEVVYGRCDAAEARCFCHLWWWR
jgi:hypothetical protein